MPRRYDSIGFKGVALRKQGGKGNLLYMKPARILLNGAPVTAKEVAKHKGLPREEQLRIQAQVAKILARTAAAGKSTQRSTTRLVVKRSANG